MHPESDRQDQQDDQKHTHCAFLRVGPVERSAVHLPGQLHLRISGILRLGRFDRIPDLLHQCLLCCQPGRADPHDPFLRPDLILTGQGGCDRNKSAFLIRLPCDASILLDHAGRRNVIVRLNSAILQFRRQIQRGSDLIC